MDNMLRHKKIIHGDDNSDEMLKKDDRSDESDTDESDMESDSSEKEETIDPWYDMVDYVFKSFQPEFDKIALAFVNDDDLSEKQARKKAFNELLPKYRKLLIDKYLFKILWFDSVRKDPIHTAIIWTANQLKEGDDFETEKS